MYLQKKIRTVENKYACTIHSLRGVTGFTYLSTVHWASIVQYIHCCGVQHISYSCHFGRSNRLNNIYKNNINSLQLQANF